MKYNSTLKELNAIVTEMNSFKQTFPYVSKMIGGRFNEFNKHNAVYLGILQDASLALMNKYVEKENGKYLTVNDENGNAKEWKFANDEGKEAFQKEHAELMNRPCTIIL